MNIYLIGYRGTGKTTVAQFLAQRIRWRWVDADVELEQRVGMTIADLFSKEGEQVFRDWETRVLADLAQQNQLIVATGGGVLLREENRQTIKGSGKTVWLKATPETIYKRLHTDETTQSRRPNLTKDGGLREIEKLLEQRTPIYRDCADWEIDTERSSPAAVADLIVVKLDEKLPRPEQT